MSSHVELAERWSRADDGHPLPRCLANLPAHLIERAVELREQGVLVGILPEESAAAVEREQEVQESSMQHWDKAGEFT